MIKVVMEYNIVCIYGGFHFLNRASHMVLRCVFVKPIWLLDCFQTELPLLVLPFTHTHFSMHIIN